MTRRLLALAAAAALAAGCGSSGPGAPAAAGAAATPRGAERAMGSRLAARSLSFHYVRCIDSGARAAGAVVFRCNVNYGEPHIVAYCVVVRGGRAVTQLEEPALRCNRTRTGDEP